MADDMANMSGDGTANFCECLIHPFQNDPGVSQQQRAVDVLLDASPKIDARKTADLLDYFFQLSRHINYYNSNLEISDWQPFFENSIPFSLASLIKYNSDSTKEKFEFYDSLFHKNPTKSGLQLTILFIFHNTINRLNNWHLKVKGNNKNEGNDSNKVNDLPVQRALENKIKDKLQEPMRDFIIFSKLAAKWFGIKPVDFSQIKKNDVWNIPSDKVLIDTFNQVDAEFKIRGKRKRLEKFHSKFADLFPSFLNAIKSVNKAAEQSLEQSILPLKAELQEKHTPHLGLIFAFLKLFEKLQGDLNNFTKKHLDFFYKEVLKLKAKDAVADKAHIVFEIQKELDQYLFANGLLVKDGKDVNKQEIRFSLDDEIVVNKAQVKDVRSLYLNNQIIPNPLNPSENIALLEGVYMAPDATKADGIDKDFQTDVKNYYTVGNKESKYALPGTNVFKPYPNSRLGFILASPVLLLNEGTRTVTITLQCQLNNSICHDLGIHLTDESNPCCDKIIPNDQVVIKETNDFPEFIEASQIYSLIKTHIDKTFYYVNAEIIQELIKKGIDADLIAELKEEFLTITNEVCFCPVKTLVYEKIIEENEWNGFSTLSNRELLNEFIKPLKPLKILFSGDSEWIEPSTIEEISLSDLSGDKFTLTIQSVLESDKPAVTFYNDKNLEEGLDITLPLVKIELDDKYKLIIEDQITDEGACCLFRDLKFENDEIPISFYHFFRNVIVIEALNGENSRIDVQVCGIKNFIVQNDESVLDVNSPFPPFGSRPDIIDFTVQKMPPPVGANLIGPNFYLGSEEIFFKKWETLRINLNWKDKPTDFNEYYKAYWVNPALMTEFGLFKDNFHIQIAVLENGKWKNEPSPAPSNGIRKLFDSTNFWDPALTLLPILPPPPPPPLSSLPPSPLCIPANDYEQKILVYSKPFSLNQKYIIDQHINKKLESTTLNGFLKITLRDQDFLHKDYPFVLARQMMAFGKLPDQHVESAVYYDPASGGGPIVISTTIMLNALNNSGPIARRVNLDVKDLNRTTMIGIDNVGAILNPIADPPAQNIRNIFRVPNTPPGTLSLNSGAAKLDVLLNGDGTPANPGILPILNNIKDYAAIIPNEPWTPIISSMILDYTATATLEDITLIHLYPYTGTYKQEEIQLQPTLFPTFCDEGTLFLGLESLIPGNNLNILFQLAEATADSEAEKEDVHWHYLDNNVWKPLRTGFEVLDDATENLTTSGVIKFELPENMTNQNTVMPKDLHWIKATISKSSKSVSETTGIHTQAIRVTFTNTAENDKLRLSQPLEKEKISKLNTADANVKKVWQPYESFQGLVPEEEGMFYVRVSELLRHKGRAIQKFDYERIVLDAFPQVFKTKCINHSFALNAHLYKNDFPYSPGYVLLAVIPDLNKLKAGNSFSPKVPVSILENIEEYLRKRTSTFVRFRAMNPRYEMVHFCLKVKLVLGKDENYYKEKLKEDLRGFLAPWAIGDIYNYKLTFGQSVNRSDIVQFLETRDYVDFILELNMRHDDTEGFPAIADAPVEIRPKTPRSILIAGDIDVCIDSQTCEKWNEDENPCDHEKIKIIEYCKQ